MAEKRFDIVIIGTGTAAQTAAPLLAAEGRKCAVVDSRRPGGTCALRGCDAKKVLAGVAQAVDQARRLEGLGIQAEQLTLDWSELMRFKRTFTEPIPEQMEQFFDRQGVELFRRQARFLDPHRMQVGEDILSADQFLIAAGAKPAPLPIPGAEHLHTSYQFLELDALPRRMITVGGGYISIEFAHIAARAGSEVIVLEMRDRPLQMFDADLVDDLLEAGREEGIDVRLSTTVKKIRRDGDRYEVTASGAEGESVLETDLVLHAAGRVPQIDDLDLDSAARNGRYERTGRKEFRPRVRSTSQRYLELVFQPAEKSRVWRFQNPDRARQRTNSRRTLFGPEAEEIINFFALAIRRGMTMRELTDTVYSYPSIAYNFRNMIS